MLSDFDRWLEYHTEAYAGFGKWITDNPDQVRFMRRLLEPYGITQLQSATDRLYALDDQPRGYGEHARKIRQIISESGGPGDSQPTGPEVRDDHLTARCWRCMDYGSVSVLSPATLKRMHAGDSSHGLMTCAVACNCDAGRKYTRLPKWSNSANLVRYEDVLDYASENHVDMWEAALIVEREAARHVLPQATELTGDVLP
jgi:hypothetical protein